MTQYAELIDRLEDQMHQQAAVLHYAAAKAFYEAATAIRELQADAERYRWLRDSKHSGAMIRLLYEDGEVTPEFVDQKIDAAIDAALPQKAKP